MDKLSYDGIKSWEDKPKDGMTVPPNDYKRMMTAEILLRVLLAADIGKYGRDDGTVEAVRMVYNEEKEKGNAK